MLLFILDLGGLQRSTIGENI